MIEVNEENFQQEVLESDIPVVVDFWASWCGPCKVLSPILDETSKERSDVKIVKINVDDNQDLATKYGVRGIPTLMVFKNSVPSSVKVGSMSKVDLTRYIDSNV